jgi:LacI family transcriptional regulator
MPKPRRVAMMLDLAWSLKWHTGIFAGAQKYAREHGWESHIDEMAEHTLPAKPGKPVPYDGIIARATRQLANRAGRLKVPVVNVWNNSPVWSQLPGVFKDNLASGRMKAEHMMARGLRRFAGLVLKGARGEQLELESILETLEESGHSCDCMKIDMDSLSMFTLWKKVKKQLEAWIDRWRLPIGLFVGSDMVGRILTMMCMDRGLRVPQDVAIIAGRNQEPYCLHCRPTLTSVEAGYANIGYEAARLLDRLMAGKAPPAEPILVPPVALVARESTDFYAIDDELMAAALRFIATNSHRRIRSDDVADAVSVSLRTLKRRFGKFLNRPIASEIRRVRIESAKRELLQGDRSLSLIARDVGFGTAARMCEVFRRELGTTPSLYRRQRQLERPG